MFDKQTFRLEPGGHWDPELITFCQKRPFVFEAVSLLLGHTCVKGGKAAVEPPKTKPIFWGQQLLAEIAAQGLHALFGRHFPALVEGSEETHQRVQEQDREQADDFGVAKDAHGYASAGNCNVAQIFDHVITKCTIAVVRLHYI